GSESTLEDVGARRRVLSTLRRGTGDEAQLLTAAAQAFTAGVDVDWRSLFEGTGARRIDLPTYPFQRSRYWPVLRAETPTEQEPAPEPDEHFPVTRDRKSTRLN